MGNEDTVSKQKGEITALHIILAVFLFMITVFYFSWWGYKWVNYLLSAAFNVATESTVFDLLIGLVAMIASVLIFIGLLRSFRLKASAYGLLRYGAIGFLIKNALDIASDIEPLTGLGTISSVQIKATSWLIAWDIFQAAFWVFVLVYFGRKAFRERLS